MAVFLQVLLMVFVAEMGDKTQFLMIAMASKYKVRDIIIGVGAAILVLNALAIVIGAVLGGVIPTAAIGIVAGLAFFWFAFTALGGEGGEENEKVGGVGKFGAILTVFGTFFLAELGDKTQLTALTVAADNGFEKMIPVFLGASLGLFAADMLGFAVGYFLGKSLPASVFNWISFAIFSVFGVLKLIEGFEETYASLENNKLFVVLSVALISIVFVAACTVKLILHYRHGNKEKQ